MADKIINNSLSKEKPPKKKKSGTKNKSGKLGLWKIVLHTFAILFFMAILFFVLVFIGLFGPVPSKQPLQEIINPVASEV